MTKTQTALLRERIESELGTLRASLHLLAEHPNYVAAILRDGARELDRLAFETRKAARTA